MDDPRPAPGSAAFADVVDALRAMEIRSDLTVREIPAPSSLAPDAYALAGDVRPEPGETASEWGTGRFILLHDASQPDAWEGPWRIVCFAQAWSWLTDALEVRGARFHAASGTATKTLSKGFGSLAVEQDGAQIELRASWSPEGDLTAHVDAWAELVCMLAGLPPGSEGVAVLAPHRTARD